MIQVIDRDRLFRVFSEYLNLFFSKNSVEGINVTVRGNSKIVEMPLGHIFVENLLRKGVVKRVVQTDKDSFEFIYDETRIALINLELIRDDWYIFMIAVVEFFNKYLENTSIMIEIEDSEYIEFQEIKLLQ